MPFPLAHPAAVLPLKRYRSRWLNFPALVIGSLAPDAAYVFRNEDISTLSHQVVGSITFGLPTGFLMLAVLYLLRVPAVGMLPNPERSLLLPLCRRPIGPLWLAAVSLVIGIWTHVFWDSFTHSDGWIVGHLSILQMPVFIFAGRTARVCHLLWYASSFAGAGWLLVEIEKWKWRDEPGMGRITVRSWIRYAILLSLLIIPVSLVRHLVRNTTGFLLSAVLCTILVIVFAIRMTRTRRRMRS
jgi:hypothetical protein